MIDKYTHQLIADGFVQQRSHNRRVNAARQAQQDFAVANFFAHGSDRVGNNIARRPVARALANISYEATDDLLTLRSVRHFRVKLHAIEFARRIFHGGER